MLAIFSGDLGFRIVSNSFRDRRASSSPSRRERALRILLLTAAYRLIGLAWLGI